MNGPIKPLNMINLFFGLQQLLASKFKPRVISIVVIVCYIPNFQSQSPLCEGTHFDSPIVHVRAVQTRNSRKLLPHFWIALTNDEDSPPVQVVVEAHRHIKLYSARSLEV